MLKTIKLAIMATGVAAIGLAAAAPAQARPHHRQKVCHAERVHGHLVRRCHYR